MLKKLSIMLLLAAAVAAYGSPIVWNNGAANGSTNRCDETNPDCGSTGWTVLDNFNLATGTTVTGFTYNDFFFAGSSTNYISTVWTIFAGNPFTTAPIFSGTSVATLTPGAIGDYLFTVTGLNLNLAAGTYWLGIANNLSGGLTTRATAAGNGLPGYKQMDNTGSFKFDLSGDTAFTIEGGNVVPEPSSLLLLGTGVIGAIGAVRRRLSA